MFKALRGKRQSDSAARWLEYIHGFEQKQSIVRDSVCTEAVIKGNECTFLVADSGNAEAQTRGPNGLIPARGDNNAQPTATLREWHDLVRKPNFNVFASQGNQIRIMQNTTMAVVNRKIDQDIIAALNTGTLNTGAAAVASMDLVTKAKTILGNNEVPWDGNVCALISSSFEGYLEGIESYASADYVNVRPLPTSDAAWNDTKKAKIWRGIKWIVHPRLPGKGTNAEKCFMYHRDAVGHGMNRDDMDVAVGYDREQAYSWSRVSADMGSQKLQNQGIVVMNHDGSAHVSA